MLAGLVLAPLLLGVINRTKALFAGRRGRRCCKPYRDLGKLLRKGAVYSRPRPGCSAPGRSWARGGRRWAGARAAGRQPALLAFSGDFILLAYLLGTARFFDGAGRAGHRFGFEGMGASREVQFSALAEPALLLAWRRWCGPPARARSRHAMGRVSGASGLPSLPVAVLVAAALFIVLLAENARIPSTIRTPTSS